jgi:uncharacterized membrane protein/mono/diheme cytochrome c family protein
MRCFLLVLALSALTAVHVAHAEAPSDEASVIARGRKLLDMQGCTACHSLDGSVSAGPSFYGRFGKSVDVVVADRPRRLTFDEAYVRESVAEPGAAVTVGFAKGVMPQFTLTEEQLSAITAALAHLGEQPPLSPDGADDNAPSPIRVLALFVLWFVGGHLILSGASLRARLVQRLGERGFQALYSLIVTAGLVGTIWAYSQAPYLELWPAFTWTRWVPLVLMPLSVLFAVCGFTTKAPTRVGQADALAQEAVGIQRITRHPQLWSYVLWSVSHLPPNGDAAALLFFGSFGALAVLGMLHIEHRRMADHGPAWQQFEARTSIVPFEAIVEKRNKFVFREIGLWRVALAAAIYALMMWSHGYLFGASPWP